MIAIWQKIRVFVAQHKIASTLAIVVVAGGGYYIYGRLTSTAADPRYVTATASKGTVIVAVSGTGQVSASNQVDIKPKVSADVVSVPVSVGQSVKAGAVIAYLDATNARKAVRDAQVNLDSAKLSLQKLQQPADTLSITQAQNSLASAQDSLANAQGDLVKDYDSAFTATAEAFVDLPTIMTSLQDMLYTTNPTLGGGGQWATNYYALASVQYNPNVQQYKDDLYSKYQKVRVSYDKNFSDYKAASRTSATSTIQDLTDQTYKTAQGIAEVVKGASTLIQAYQDALTGAGIKYISLSDTQLNTLNGYTSRLNSNLSSLLAASNSIKNDRDAITSAQRQIIASSQSLAKLQSGTDPLDIQSAQLSVTQRQNALLDAQQALADYTVRAPFDGTLAKVSVQPADSASPGTSVATLITKRQLAEISLNEVDAAKIKVGQKATLTFDAVSGLTITGQVAQLDTVGTVSQGVVTYMAQIAFDTQDDRVKSGMSVSASIITNVAADVLVVPNGAIKTQNGTSYVEVFSSPLMGGNSAQGAISLTAPKSVTVQTGLSDDTNTEIVSGLKEGDTVVTRTIAASAATAQSTPSLFGNTNNRAGTGAVRAIGR